jgi:hypothetical protein
MHAGGSRQEEHIMGHDLDTRIATDDQRNCRPQLGALHDDPKPTFGRYLGLINGRS